MIWQWMKDKKPCANLLKRRDEGDVAVVYGKTLEICYLNKTAGIVLELSDGTRTMADIELNMLERFDVEPETLEADIINIVRDLQWKRLLRVEG